MIPGSRELPAGYDHPHASEEARAVAERGTILRAQVGSGVHGTERAVRRGELRLPEVTELVDQAERQLVRLRDSSRLAAQPDRAWVDAWLHRSYLAFWAR